MRPLEALAAALLALPLLLAGCDEAPDSLRMGSKDFSESAILAEMMAALAEEEGIAVTRRTNLGDTLTNLEGLKSGEIDLYPEYNGTGLVMLGQPAIADGDEAMERVRALYEPLGLVWGERFGFDNTYGLAMRAGRAEELGLETISDLVGEAGALTIGMDENFASRPLDGFEPMTARYGMEFGDATVVEPEERVGLYDALLAGEADVIEVFTTDSQIADLDLVLLEDDLGFFPVYEAAPLVRADALVRFPALREALGRLAGTLDAEAMRRLNAQVDEDALSPREVARAALAEAGLIEADEGIEIAEPLLVALSPLIASEDETGLALRAVRSAFPGRRVLLAPRDDPLASVAAGEAALGLVAAVEMAELGGEGAPEARPFEGAGVVGQALVHLVSLGEARDLMGIERLATGPVGSASHRAGAILAAGLGGIELMPLPGEDFAAEARASGADAALVLAPLGAPAAEALLEDGALIDVEGWEQGNNLVRFPQLRQARIPAGTYEGQSRPVETLNSQLVLAGPVVADVDAVGPQGPGASLPTEVSALSDDAVLAIDEALGAGSGLDPAVRRAAALTPVLPEQAAAVNPSTSISALTTAVLALFGWLIWLYARPERR